MTLQRTIELFFIIITCLLFTLWHTLLFLIDMIDGNYDEDDDLDSGVGAYFTVDGNIDPVKRADKDYIDDLNVPLYERGIRH